jgi:hypothetical protein
LEKESRDEKGGLFLDVESCGVLNGGHLGEGLTGGIDDERGHRWGRVTTLHGYIGGRDA